MKIIVAERIKELMKENGYNQIKLAEKAGVKQNTISAWLHEKKEPSIRSLWLLADCFDVDIDYLVGRKVTVYYDPDDRSRYFVDIDSAEADYSMNAPEVHDFRN